MQQANSEVQTDDSRLRFFQSFIGQSMSQSISPVGRWLNGTLLAIEPGAMKMSFVIGPDMINPMMVLHGGIAATILDDVIGTMVYALGREHAYTSVNLNCDFLHAAKLGDTLIAHAFVVRAGRNIIHVEAELVDEQGKIIAKCSSNMIQTSLKIPALPVNGADKKS
ncbi:PaaI family thioesterase [Dyadobacter tibetensis]|uniref:PaaI family thioesterase n=1 Tax=Dyadobacter tibetensis TaxID=1211851 RepID=UPI000472C8A6|nr:PaaI family thioesterase [Dyadobacter tibetensis]